MRFSPYGSLPGSSVLDSYPVFTTDLEPVGFEMQLAMDSISLLIKTLFSKRVLLAAEVLRDQAYILI